MKREKVKLVSEDEAIVGVPAIVVGEVVGVHVPLTIITIHVGDRDASCHAPSVPLSVKYFPDCI